MLKKFIGYYKPHKKLFILDMSCAFFISILDLIFPMFSRKLVNDVIPAGNMDILFRWSLIMVGFFILRYIASYIVSYWGHVLGVYIEHDMRKDIFSHLQTLPFNFYDNTKTGHIMSRIVNDLRDITELAHHGPEDLFISLVMLLGSFILLFTIEWRLTLIVFACIPVIIFFSMSKRKKMQESFRQVRHKIADINSQIENSVSGVRVSKAFTTEEYEKEKFDFGNEQYKYARQDAYKCMAEFEAGIGMLTNILDLIVISVGGFFVYKGYINIGDLLAYTMFVSIFMQPIRRLASFMQQYQEGMTGFERFVEIMEIRPDIEDRPDAIDLEDVKGNIEFDKVTFEYENDDEKVLNSLSLSIDAGKTVAIVGPSGAGKTTLCHLIPRFYDVTEGRVLIDSKDIRDIKMKSLRENIGIVQQDVFLFTGTVAENIAYGDLDADMDQIVEAAKKAKIHDFIMELSEGYDTFVGEKGVMLSGGQKQRISIARLFLKNPPILILDEATSALDNQTEILIQESLEELSKGRTTLVIAHRLSTIKNADEIIVLTETGVEERGDHFSLLDKSGIYADLYNSQFKNLVG